ncbi:MULTISPECIES: RNA ligase family protein [Enterobacterales]|uniref:RNA ligase family protein n=1 Tax=Enterobacterales TaxID=91347 RepID=UPI000847DFFF|nr:MULTISPECIES: RNA ligase family protein [Enterobacterales]WOO48272.1 RNA ligase family protein [Hafnia alvei]MCK9781553.1 RNA ligase family protein [Proteus columbae]MCT6516129.1 RNA ligase family protein [Proteus vulgaris]ODQ05264.1 2'-5' RNA ligase [Shigella sp. FC130]OEI92716.1 2'-5' RNA ligase [Shigella sp. FC1655]
MNNQSQKYDRTYHYPFSPGTTNDDRINAQWWQDICQIKQLIHTEKLDGENNCLNKMGVFARSHATPTQSAWTSQLRQRWQMMKNDLGELDIFGENLYAIHSIEYAHLEEYFYVFAVRYKDKWLSWEEVQFYASLFDLPTVPEITLPKCQDKTDFENMIVSQAKQASFFQSYDVLTQKMSPMEGIVTRDAHAFSLDDFSHRVFKYVRKDHVKTDVHWKKNWRRAPLIWEKVQESQ